MADESRALRPISTRAAVRALNAMGGEPALPVEPEDTTLAATELGEARTTVHYYFPVEIEVRAATSDLIGEEIVERALHRLAAHLENA
jgi:hypothetical protein